MKEIRKNCEKYKIGVKETIEDVRKILNDLKMNKEPEISEFNGLFNQTKEEIIASWTSGRKYSRTSFLQKAFKEDFPEDYLQFSLSIDVMINILDDFLDEDLEEEKRRNYVIEFLRNFSFYNYKKVPEELRQSFGLYLSKLITLALSENVFESEIMSLSDFDKIVKMSVDLLKCRGMDIDIFTEIALVKKKDYRNEILEISRLFRGLNIFKKDILDISYDKENGMRSVVTIVSDKDENFNFQNYSKGVVDTIVKEADNISKNKSDILSNFYNMILEEKREIYRLSDSV